MIEKSLGKPGPVPLVEEQAGLRRTTDLSPRRYLPADLHVEKGSLAATWWAQRPGGNWYWRCEVPSRHLPGQVLQLRTSDLKMVDGEVTMPRHEGAAVWSYPGNATRGILMRAQQNAGATVMVEVDDNYLIQSPQVPGWKSGDWEARIGKGDKHTHEAHRRLAAFADGVIVTTETLARAYRQVNGNVHVCRNSVDLDDWPEPHKPDDGLFRIGYAASHSHWFDAADTRRALSWAAEQPGVQVVLYGLDPKWGFDYLHIPWTRDLSAYRKSLQLLDVGLCPLREGTWADAKSDIKHLEYALSGACSIVASRPPYEEWLDGEACLIASTGKEFLKQVRWIVRNQDAAKEMRDKALTRILESRLIQHEIVRWREAVCG